MTPKEDPRRRTGGQGEKAEDVYNPTTMWHGGQGQFPPHDLNLEKSILVSMLMAPTAIDAVKEIIIPQDCYQTRHQQIISTIFEMHIRGEPVDLLTVGTACCGQAAYLAELADHPIASNVAHYAKKVAALAQRRKLWAAGYRIVKLALNGDAGDDPVALALAEIESIKNGSTGDHRGFKFVLADDMERKPVEWLIRDMLERACLSCLFGDYGSAKSFLLVAMACCVSTGSDFYGMPVKQGPVAIIAGEGLRGFGRRIDAYKIRHGFQEQRLPIAVSNSAASIINDEATVAAALRTMAKKVGPHALIIIDTVARNFGSGDENSTADMTKFVAAVDRLRAPYEAAVQMAHHVGHADKSRTRGAIALPAALDFQFRIEKGIDEVFRLTATKVKDGPFPEPMAFKLRPVDLGYLDEDQNPVTSAVLDRVEFVPPAKEQTARLGTNETTALDVLTGLYERSRKNLEAGGYSHEPSVELTEWKRCLNEKGILKNRFYDVKRTLLEKKMIWIEPPFVFLSDLGSGGPPAGVL